MWTLGVDLGGTNILARLIDVHSGKSLGRVKASTPRQGPDAVIAKVVEVICSVEGWQDAAAIGVGLPGLVRRGGIVDRCPNIAGWESPIAVAEELERALGRPVAVGNDVNCGALAEHRLGAGRGVDDLLAVFVGTGVGGGMIMGGRLVEGERGMAGEIGHLTVEPGGRPCGCGGHGHLEAYAGRAGIERELHRLGAQGVQSPLIRQAADGPIKSRHLHDAVHRGDPVAETLLQQAADALAQGIGNVAMIADIDRVVMGGGVVDKFGESFLDRVRASSAFGGFGSSVCELQLAHRLDDAGAVGAAILAADALEAPRHH